MSQPATPPPRIPVAARHYQALCALALVAIFLVQMEQSFPLLLNALMMVLGAVGVLFRVRMSPLLFFMAMAAGHLIDQHNQNQFFNPDTRPGRFLDVTTVVLSAATLSYLVGQYRLHGLWFHVLPHDPRQRAAPSTPASRWQSVSDEQARTEGSLTPTEFLWLLMPLPVLVLLAEVFVMLLAQPWNLVGYPPRWRQFLAVAWLVVVVLFVFAHLFRYWQRVQMDRAAALLLLQDTLWHETRGEQRRINRWIAWRKIKQREES